MQDMAADQLTDDSDLRGGGEPPPTCATGEIFSERCSLLRLSFMFYFLSTNGFISNQQQNITLILQYSTLIGSMHSKAAA